MGIPLTLGRLRRDIVATPGRAPGQTAPGNLDVTKRPVVHNQDGSISTVRSLTVGTDNGSYVIPSVVEDRVVPNDVAIRHFQQTGENFGAFGSDAEADRYAQVLHQSQAMAYPSEPWRADEYLDALVHDMVRRRYGAQ